MQGLNGEIALDTKNVLVGYGATVEPLNELVSLAPVFTAEDIAELIRIGAYHLNDMQAACDHQTVQGSGRDALDNTPPCPVTGYKYGHAWLVKPLPDDITPEHVRAILHQPS